MWRVLVHPAAESEYLALTAREAVAVDNAVAKLIGAYAPEAMSNPRGFEQACRNAVRRIDELEE